MRRTLLLAILSIACLLGAVSALAEIDAAKNGAKGGAMADEAVAEPYRAGPLASRAEADPVDLFDGVGEGLALVTLLGLGLGLRWADRAGPARRRARSRARSQSPSRLWATGDLSLR